MSSTSDSATPAPTARPVALASLPEKRPVALSSLRGDREFRKVRSHGVVVRQRHFNLRLTDYRPRYGEAWQPRAIIGIVVPKKILKRAVDRNRARRRVREALRRLPELRPCRAILSPAASVLDVPFAELQRSLAQALSKQALSKPPGKLSGRSRQATDAPGGTK